jgi:hypothetical protein
MTTKNDKSLTTVDVATGHADVEGAVDAGPQVSQWYWVNVPDDEGDETTEREPGWLACVTHVGSNYVELRGIYENGKEARRSSTRVHLENFADICQRELQAERYIAERSENHQAAVRKLLGKVQELTARLGVGHREALNDGNETQALVVATSSQPVEDYKRALVKAQETTLPKLFESIAKEHEALALWMTASTFALEAQTDALRGSVDLIKGRIFAVQLYAGLTEDVAEVASGAPAGEDEPIRLMQRRCYMDEECLAQYEAGGMDFESIDAFDKWLARPSNRGRLLPFPRCVVAFRVRRNTKEREAVDIRSFFEIRIKDDADKATFLYIRNGDRLYRLTTTIEFGAKLFPDLDRQQMTQRMWAKMFADRVERLITHGEYLQMQQENKAERDAYEKMTKKERDETPHWNGFHDRHRLDDYKPFDSSSVHYDDISKHVADEMTKHNRLVLVLQGLLDRSPVFHPHPPWQIHTQAGFQQALRLVFDEDRALVAGASPDFEAYRNTLNGLLVNGSMTVGQEHQWLLHEGKKEIARRDRSWRERSRDYRYYIKESRPHGDPGPGLVAPVAHLSRGGKVTYRWQRPRQSRSRLGWFQVAKTGPINRSFTCDVDSVLNIDAYEPGDFRIFFSDPRTRAKYLMWAPLLLRAEDYKAGKLKRKDDQ